MLGWAIVYAVAPHFYDDHGALIFVDDEGDAKRIHEHHAKITVARLPELAWIVPKQAINLVGGVSDLATSRWL